jgi:hypothetical protein
LEAASDGGLFRYFEPEAMAAYDGTSLRLRHRTVLVANGAKRTLAEAGAEWLGRE